jgi:hypothetical protein
VAGRGEGSSNSTERSLLGAAGSLIGRHAFSGEAEVLPGLLPDLTEFILTPYLGPVESRRVALGSCSLPRHFESPQWFHLRRSRTDRDDRSLLFEPTHHFV